jgi:hypothetical protein
MNLAVVTGGRSRVILPMGHAREAVISRDLGRTSPPIRRESDLSVAVARTVPRRDEEWPPTPSFHDRKDHQQTANTLAARRALLTASRRRSLPQASRRA